MQSAKQETQSSRSTFQVKDDEADLEQVSSANHFLSEISEYMAGVIGVWWKNPDLWQFLIIGFFFFFFIYQNSKFASFQSDEGLYMHFKTQGLKVNPFTHTHTHTTEPPSTTVDTNQVGSVFSRRLCKIPTRPSESRSCDQDSRQDRASISQSSVGQFWRACVN